MQDEIIVRLRGYHLTSSLIEPNKHGCHVTIREKNGLTIKGTCYVSTADPMEALQQAVTQCGREYLDQIPGYLSERDDLNEIERQLREQGDPRRFR